jgi:hypothetical protein
VKILVLTLALVACGGNAPTPTVEQRFHEIDAIGTRPEDWAQLVEIAAGEHHWAGRLNTASELATRCRALKHLSSNRVFMPPQFIGSVYRRYSEHLDSQEAARRVLRLLDDSSICEGTTIAALIADFIEGVCAVPSLRPELEKRHLVRAVALIDRLAAWHPSDAANRIEQAIASGDVPAFRKAIAILAGTLESDRASVSDTARAVFDWLRALVYQSPDLACCGPLETAIADGELGEEFVARLAVETDREVRRAMWLVLATQPRPKSAARLREIADNEPDPDVKFEANDALGLAKVGGQRVHDQLENAKHQLHPDAGQ